MDYDYDETEDVDILTMGQPGGPPHLRFKVGYAKASRTVYLNGDLHPLGAATALLQAAKEGVPYISLGAVSALYPENWLRACCQHDAERMRIINSICHGLRGTA